jgi:fumarate hydratase subunit beta
MRTVRVDLPGSREIIKTLRIGDEVRLFGRIVTGRDAAHKYLVEEECPANIRALLKDSVIYHCGPVVKREGDGWRVVAAGPTTSIREEPYQAKVIAEYGLVGAMGKGGMGARTLAGLAESGAVYLHAVGGVASLLAERIKQVTEVHMLEEFGAPEAFWVLEVEDFPALVTMDSEGGSVHERILESSTEAFKEKIQG